MNQRRQVVSDTGPLISLEKLSDGYKFIRMLYETILIPPAVLDEVVHDQFETPTVYLHYYGITDLIEVCPVSLEQELSELERLHDGEKQAIQLAIERKLPLLIEETVGRDIAERLGIQFSGIAGQIIRAFREGYISLPEVYSKLSELFQGGRINKKIYENLIAGTSST